MSDFCYPFALNTVNARGRLVRITPSLQTIISQHNYPPVINAFLCEMSALALALIDGIKFEGNLTLQINSSGPVTLLVVHVNHLNEFRATARYDKSKHDELLAMKPPYSVHDFFKDGFILLTLNQENQKDLFQSTVELMGRSISESLQHLFRQSEQIETGLVATSCFSAQNLTSDCETAACLMIQKMPLSADMDPDEMHDLMIDALARLGTLKPQEMLDSQISAEQLIHRLFWDFNYEIYNPKAITHKCTCSLERITQMLEQFSMDEILQMAQDTPNIEVVCEFCNKKYEIDKHDYALKNSTI